MDLITPLLEPAFREAGWFPDRSVEVAGDVSHTHPAYHILRAFGGLTVGITGPGEDCASSDIAFGCTPCHCASIDDWEHALNTELVCLGDYHNGHGQLWLDRQGRLFSQGMVAPMMLFEGNSFAEGVEALLKGRRSKPMLLPWQSEVVVWGERFRAGDPRVLTPDFFMGS
jgi:hypothetical protein